MKPKIYEYMLHTWGGFYNEEHQKIHGKESGYFFFNTKKDREDYLKSLKKISEDLDATVLMCTKEEGYNVRFKTIAVIKLEHDGKHYSFKYDFGYAYPVNAAYFMFNDGNYACDCNLSLFIRDKCDDSFPELPCGASIEILDVEVILVNPDTQEVILPSQIN